MQTPDIDRKQFYHILTRKIRSLILIVSFTPMILTTGILFYRFQATYTEKIRAHISELVQKHSRNIDVFLYEKLGNIRHLAYQVPTDGQAKSFLTRNLALLNTAYGNAFTDLGLIDETGIQFAYEGPFKLENADYSQAQWFIKAKNTPYSISDVFAGLRGHPHFIIAVKMNSGGMGHVLRATVNFGAFNDLVENIHIGKTGSAFIINGKGQLQTDSSVIPNENIIALVAARDNLNGEPFFSEQKDKTGNKQLSVASKLKHIDWRMVFQQDVSDAYHELRKTQALTIAIFLLGCAAIGFVAVTLPRTIVKRISESDQQNEAMSRQVVESGKLATIGELAAGIAHEINNPVAIMVEEAGWIEDLLEEEDIRPCKNLDEFKKSLTQIHTQGKRCKDITHKLLSFARKTDSAHTDIQINDAVTQIVSLTAQMARYNNVTIKTVFQEPLPYVRLSLSELQQVILNLVNNAIDAMEKSGGTIIIQTRTFEQETNYLIISIEDNGPGIPKENLERIFDPFFTTKAVGKGTGLGLSICYGIIQKMGGKIDVYSQLGIGTKFKIWLPLTEEADQNNDMNQPNE